jgi:peptide/nickel transport system substrate-binding protein
MAIDGQEILDSYYGGFGDLLAWPVAPFPEDMDMYTPLEELPESTSKLFGYYPDEAKQLLAEAGYPDGFKTEVLVNATTTDLMAIVQSMWADIGVEVEMVVRETAAYNSLMYGKKYDVLMGGYSPTNPFRYYYEQAGSFINFSNVEDPVITAGFNEIAASRFDEPKRRALVKEHVPYRLDLAYYLQLPNGFSYYFWTPWVKGYNGEYSAGYAHHYDFARNIWIDQDLREEMTGKR